MTEAAAVTPEGRISPQDLGTWRDDHIEFLARCGAGIPSLRSGGALPAACFGGETPP